MSLESYREEYWARRARLGMVGKPQAIKRLPAPPVKPAKPIPPPPNTNPLRITFIEGGQIIERDFPEHSIIPIQRAVCARFKISREELLSDRRHPGAVIPRHVAMYLCKQLTLCSMPEIGRKFGGRDHTTVIHAVSKMGRRMAANQQLFDTVNELEMQLRVG